MNFLFIYYCIFIFILFFSAILTGLSNIT